MAWFINEMTERLIKQMEKCNRWGTVDIFLFIFCLRCVWKTHFQKSDYTISNFKSFNRLCCWSAMITEGTKKKEETTVAEGILSPPASCHFCSTAHLSRVMSNRSVPGGQISTLSLSQWQFKSQSSLQPVWTSEPLTTSEKKGVWGAGGVLKIKQANLRAQARMQSGKVTTLELGGGDFEIEDVSFIRSINAKLYFNTKIKKKNKSEEAYWTPWRNAAFISSQK